MYIFIRPYMYKDTRTQADVSGMAVEIEPSHQCSITFCCCVTDGS